jgi:uncharacterized membrane protein YccC
MAARKRASRHGWWRLLGYAVAAAGAVVVVLSLPGWLWLLALGVLLVWAGLLVAMGPR